MGSPRPLTDTAGLQAGALPEVLPPLQRAKTAPDAGKGSIAAELIVAHWRDWLAPALVAEARILVEQVLTFTSVNTSRERAEVLNVAGALALKAGDRDSAERRFEEASTSWRDWATSPACAVPLAISA